MGPDNPNFTPRVLIWR